MYNDFVLIGPGDDPAGIADADDALDAFSRIAASGTPFTSRGDDSGTHRAEQWHQWLISDEGQAAIAGYAIDGERLFFPNAKAG